MSIFSIVIGVLSLLFMNPIKVFTDTYGRIIYTFMFKDNIWFCFAVALMNLLCVLAAFSDKNHKNLATGSMIVNSVCVIVYAILGIVTYSIYIV